MTRKQIESEMEKNRQKIKLIKQENRNLFLQSLELSDKQQWYEEKLVPVKVRDNGKIVKKDSLIGYINWNEYFMDEDTGKKMKIERCQEVKRNGIWIV